MLSASIDPFRPGRKRRRLHPLLLDAAVRIARPLSGKQAYDEAFWDEIRAAFSAAEIADLIASCAKWLGLGRINAVLGLAVACPIRIAPPRHAERVPA
ncbi:carboxymuconolactone decarboxylase family protein [Rhizorhabdus sp. FW153]|uniref:hypothetical protein n=1 Tax=Rhizorhabdus sp. FW153 TaxID=3400216 RepID=UPI003CF2E283